VLSFKLYVARSSLTCSSFKTFNSQQPTLRLATITSTTRAFPSTCCDINHLQTLDYFSTQLWITNVPRFLIYSEEYTENIFIFLKQIYEHIRPRKCNGGKSHKLSSQNVRREVCDLYTVIYISSEHFTALRNTTSYNVINSFLKTSFYDSWHLNHHYWNKCSDLHVNTFRQWASVIKAATEMNVPDYFPD